MIEDNSDNPTSDDLILAAFERLPVEGKMRVMEDLVCDLSESLSKFSDPVLERETEVFYDVWFNLNIRLKEIKSIYGEPKG